MIHDRGAQLFLGSEEARPPVSNQAQERLALEQGGRWGLAWGVVLFVGGRLGTSDTSSDFRLLERQRWVLFLLLTPPFRGIEQQAPGEDLVGQRDRIRDCICPRSRGAQRNHHVNYMSLRDDYITPASHAK